MPVPDATISTDAYKVSCLDERDPFADMFTIRVEHQGGDLWAVLDGSRYLNQTGGWDPDLDLGGGRNVWVRDHCFALQRALDLAVVAAKQMTAGDLSLIDLLAKREARTGGAR